MLIVLATSPRVAPGLLSWPAWEALRSAAAVCAPAGHPLLPALDEAGIAYRVASEPDAGLCASDAVVVWLPEPGADPALPPGAQLIRGSADLPGAHLLDLVATMDRLRVECPWDAGQTHASLAPHLLEEPYEALEALESGDEQALCEELGDVLLQVMFHARIAAERDDGTGFTIDDVADGIVAKLVRRHPHVFGDVTVSGPDEVKRNWDEIKREEKRARASAHGDGSRAGPSVGARRRAVRAACAGAGGAASAPGGAGRSARRTGPPGRRRRRADGPARTSAASCSGWWRRRATLGSDPEMELRAAARRYRERVHAWERP